MNKRWLGLLIAALSAAVSIWAYPRLPESVPTHWNLRGEPDGYSSRLVAALIMPAAILVLTGIFQVLPRIDPRRVNYDRFRDTYWLLVNGILAYMLALHVTLTAIGMGAAIELTRVITVGGGAMFVLLGNFLGRVESNWFIGIRTPWTLSSDTVWRKTHRTAAWLFVAGGIIVIVTGLLRPRGHVGFLGVTAALVVVVPVIQSYVLWRRERAT
jgi:uncharacterized membrane protein